MPIMNWVYAYADFRSAATGGACHKGRAERVNGFISTENRTYSRQLFNISIAQLEEAASTAGRCG
jgi:hypothetical protein